LAAVAALATLANRIKVPYPILRVVSGLALAFVNPGVLPQYRLEPEVVFVLFLPPLLFSSAFFTSGQDCRQNLRPIGLLAVGLVLFTVVGVAAVAHYVVGLSWAVAAVLRRRGPPTDAEAATAVARRRGVPRRIVTLLEGESLVNDATGIVAYRIAAGAAGGARPPPWGAGAAVVGRRGGVLHRGSGPAVRGRGRRGHRRRAGRRVGSRPGLRVAQRHPGRDRRLATRPVRRVPDGGGAPPPRRARPARAVVCRAVRLLHGPPVELVVSLLAPFAAYLTAEELPHLVWHELLRFDGEPFFSGVLAAVAAGIYVGRSSPTIMSPTSRLEGGAVWNVVVFLLNGLAFILIGLQLPIILDGLRGYTNGQLLWYGAAVSLAVILVRVAWVFPATGGTRR